MSKLNLIEAMQLVRTLSIEEGLECNISLYASTHASVEVPVRNTDTSTVEPKVEEPKVEEKEAEKPAPKKRTRKSPAKKKPEPEPEVEEEEEVEEEVEEEEVETLTLEDLTPRVLAAAKELGKPAIKDLFDEFDVKKLTDLAASDYEAFNARLEEEME